MKISIYLAALIVIFSACKKETYNPAHQGNHPQPVLSAWIQPQIYEPYYAVLGDEIWMNSGEAISINVRYYVEHQHVVQGVLNVFDETGALIDAYDLRETTDADNHPSTISEFLTYNGSYSATIAIDDRFKGKKISLRAEITGTATLATTEIEEAFLVNDY